MSSLIEQAAARLEQLRRAGAIVAPGSAAPTPTASADERAPEHHDAPGAVSRRVELDFAALAAEGLLVPNAPRSLLADQYRVIKRPLLRNALGKGASKLAHGNLIMITSAVAGEGKSFSAINLALSIATELDHTVMLVDADVARPTVARKLGLERAGAGDLPGLLDVLDGRVSMAEALLKTNIDKLTVLPSGMRQERTTELLASEAMTQLLDQMARRYSDRIIIFDSPPLLQTTEARVLATHMGQVVLVVRAEHTAQAAIQDALATIESCPVRLLLLNRASAAAREGYGYVYGYWYGYGGRSAGAGVPDAPPA
jgi:protein-tyrosine kinase